MGKLSNEKGKRGELEARDLLRKFGFEARRGQQYAGGGDSPDVVHDMEGFHVEVKRVESGNPYLWLEQANRDKKDGEQAIVLHKRNRKQWIVVMDAEEFLALVKEFVFEMPPPAAHRISTHSCPHGKPWEVRCLTCEGDLYGDSQQ